MYAEHLTGAVIGGILIGTAVAGSIYSLAAAATVLHFLAVRPTPPRRSDPVTLIKPLHGDEPRLFDNLSTFLTLDHNGPIQLLLGVQRHDDPAIAVVDALRTRHPQARIDLVVDPRTHGANGKVANLINMTPHAVHRLLVISDSDIAVGPDYLAQILAVLDSADVGAVTCAYHGRGDAGFWSRVGAAWQDWHLLPGVVFGFNTGLARPCMGSTIAMQADTLAAIGGFSRFADILADDYAIGQAVIARGLKVVVAPILVTHAGGVATFRALWRQEVRSAATILKVEPLGYAASVAAMPLPIALLAVPFYPVVGVVAALGALCARATLAIAIGRVAAARPLSLALLPLRDCLTFATFVASFCARSVDWRGRTLRMSDKGRIVAEPEFP